MNPEGPSLWSWLVGRLAHPPSLDRCAQCGRAGADAEARRRLERDGQPELAAWAALCLSCRRRWLASRVLRSH